MKIINLIKNWYNGKYIPLEGNNIFGGFTHHHWTAQIARKLVKFYFDHWKWIWTTGILILLALLKVR